MTPRVGQSGRLTVTWPNEIEPFTLDVTITSVDPVTVRFDQRTRSERAPALRFAGLKPYDWSSTDSRQQCQPHIVEWEPDVE